MEPILVLPLIYCLELENYKYYVGITYNLNLRLGQHMAGSGAQWTKLYKPLKVIEVIYGNADRKMEDEMTKRYIEKYGAENVRGGSWCRT